MTAPDGLWQVVVGPTAAGKSALAMAVARARGLALISADSRQLYCGFDIGTAKPSAADREAVPHHGVDILAPTERASAHLWAEGAREWAAAARQRRTPPLVVGGTGLYVRALVAPLAPVPQLDPTHRALLASWLDRLPAEELRRWCARLDPPRATLGRTQWLRAVETALLAGTRLSQALAQGEAAGGEPARYLLVDPGPSLAERIEARVRAMVAAGWVEEVRGLSARLPGDAPAWKASGYGVWRAHVAGALSEEEAVRRVVIETRQYAKRQRTWFRHQLPPDRVTRLDPGAPDALAQALAWWDAGAEA
ncbi:MAG: tRNA (adenosine(37)-N6)-dimethylallyltransferase MiaA [Gemmatimonadetes bacterium]|nr:tRNA (adenosine(37)-N6)-dimethylallyltransferase MiaA [Gemmatimonadota bacterium]